MMILMMNQPIFTAFPMKNIFWTKIPKNGHCDIGSICLIADLHKFIFLRYTIKIAIRVTWVISLFDQVWIRFWEIDGYEPAAFTLIHQF